MQRDVLANVPGDGVRAYVVWVPMNRGLERDVPNATKEIWDSRARQYWDGEGWTMTTYKQVLGGFPFGPVWDTFILYGPEARWDGERPPRPAFWMHQRGTIKRPEAIGPYWDPQVFLQHVKDASRQ